MGESEEKKAQSKSGNGHYKKKWGHGNRNRTTPKPSVRTEKFQGGKAELNGNYFDCTGYEQSDRFVKTVQSIAEYVSQTYTCGGVSRKEVMTQKMVVILMPTRPTGSPPDPFDVSDYNSEKKTATYKVLHQTENRQKIFSLVWQQCTESMQAKLKNHGDYAVIEQLLNGIELLRIIKLICFDIQDEKYVPQKVHETKAAFYALKQGRDTDQAYHIRFLNTVHVIEQCGASLGEDPMTRTMVCRNLNLQEDTTTATEITAISKAVRDYTLGVALILGTDPDRYSGMIRGLKNASLAGRDEWPKNVPEAYSYLSKWECEDTGRPTREYEGNSFLNEQSDAGLKNDEPQPWHKAMTCRKCLKTGHIGKFCENQKAPASARTSFHASTSDTNTQDGQVNEEAEQQLIDGSKLASENEDYYADLFLCEDQEHRSVSFQLNDGINGGRIPKTWVLLDSQSTTDAFSNPSLLKDIHEVPGSLTINTQAGKCVTKLRGTVPGYGEVWFCPNGIANILSLARVIKTRKVTFDSTDGNQFTVTKNDGTNRVFEQSDTGLYYFDMQSTKHAS